MVTSLKDFLPGAPAFGMVQNAMNRQYVVERPCIRAVACRICGSTRFTKRLDLGFQPICNRFLTAPDEIEEQFPFALMQCEDCAVLQLEAVAPPEALKPRYPWITYREAEGHLDEMVRDILALAGLHRDARIIGSNYKDTTVIERFRRLGFAHADLLDPRRDLEVDADRAEIETVQDRLTPERCSLIAERNGPADVLVMRHVIEHAHDIHRFAAAVRALVRPGGLAVFEVPDFRPSLTHFDYSTLWEEHVFCFTDATLAATCARLGFEPLLVKIYPYPIENALVSMVRVSEKIQPVEIPTFDVSAELSIGEMYGREHAPRSARLQDYLDHFVRDHGPVAVFGAGHLSIKFINFMRIAPWIQFIADGDTCKIGKLLPGSRLPIVPPSELFNQRIRLCLLGLSAESEARVRKAFTAFTDSGGRFASISPISPTRLEF